MSRLDKIKAKRLDDVLRLLRTMKADGHKEVGINVVLTIASGVAEHPIRPAEEPQQEPPDPRADPMTGCLPVTAERPEDVS